MFYYLAPHLLEIWGPFRLFASYLVLIGLGTSMAVLVTWHCLPRLQQYLPLDRGRLHAHSAEKAKGKPTGAGLLFVLLQIPVLFLVLPWSAQQWLIVGCLLLACMTGFLDDRSQNPWGEYFKGSLDLLVAFLTSLALCQGEAFEIWLPLLKGSYTISPWLFVPVATVLLWISINATNCSDGVDGLAGTLTLLSLFYLGGFLYVVIGHIEVADYLLVPHNPNGANWAILLFTAAGGLAGYLWHNAEPSAMLMGDAGSRFLGLLLGIAVLASRNPVLIVVTAPVILINGGTGIVKVAMLRFFRFLGFDATRPVNIDEAASGVSNRSRSNGQYYIIRALHCFRFPLHDHCRHKLGWTNAQVLMRFVLVQALLIPILLGLLVKLR